MALISPTTATGAQHRRLPRSLLALEYGATQTCATLLAQVEGQLRLVAQGVTPATETNAVRAALDPITRATGRQLWDSVGILSPETAVGDGCDRIIVISDQAEARYASAPRLTPLTALTRYATMLTEYGDLNALVVEIGDSATRIAYASRDGDVAHFSAPGIGNGPRDAQQMSAMLCAALQQVGPLPTVDVILGTGTQLSNGIPVAEVTYALLAGLRLSGVCQIFLDVANCARTFGAASLLIPALAREGIFHDAMMIYAATCITPRGRVVAGNYRCLRAEIAYSAGQVEAIEIPTGAVTALPLALGQRAELRLYPAPGVDCGGGPGIPVSTITDIEGGRLGVIIDTRTLQR